VPPVPAELHRLEQREAGCLACHDGRRAPTLGPNVTATPSDHPPLAITKLLRDMGDADRAKLAGWIFRPEPTSPSTQEMR